MANPGRHHPAVTSTHSARKGLAFSLNQTPPMIQILQYVENSAGTMQGTYYNTEVAENDSKFMRGSKTSDQGSKGPSSPPTSPD
jgi:hypothetical protein